MSLSSMGVQAVLKLFQGCKAPQNPAAPASGLVAAPHEDKDQEFADFWRLAPVAIFCLPAAHPEKNGL